MTHHVEFAYFWKFRSLAAHEAGGDVGQCVVSVIVGGELVALLPGREISNISLSYSFIFSPPAALRLQVCQSPRGYVFSVTANSIMPLPRSRPPMIPASRRRRLIFFTSRSVLTTNSLRKGLSKASLNFAAFHEAAGEIVRAVGKRDGSPHAVRRCL